MKKGNFHSATSYAQWMLTASNRTGAPTTANYSLLTANWTYTYDNPGQPNTLSDINEESGQQFEWDALGNMTRHVHGTTDRRLCWDEQNRLLGVKDSRYLSYYQYDANGDRAYKLTGKGILQNLSGEWSRYYPLENATLYASPYMVATGQGYTKHYYAETERIASRIGGGGLGDALGSGDGNEELLVTHQAHFAEHFDAVMDCLGADAQPAEDLLKSLYNWLDSVQDEKDCYWYHPDHLGSSSWITHTDGSAVQHLHYRPWGEDFVDQRSTTWNAMYTFSAKEKDTETGYSYFGSRYYNSDLSIWLSVDPMAAKYPSLSPYVYCADNPVRCVDPNGEEIGDYFNQYGKFLGSDCSDDGKIHIIQDNNWNYFKDRISWEGNDGYAVIQKELGNMLSTKPSESNLSENAIRKIVGHYNTTGYVLKNGTDGALHTSFTSTDGISYTVHLTINAAQWKLYPVCLDSYYDIISSYDNEIGHINQCKEIGIRKFNTLTDFQIESYAVNYQQSQEIYEKTSDTFKKIVQANPGKYNKSKKH